MNFHKPKYLVGIGMTVLAVVSAIAFTKPHKTNPLPISKDIQEKNQTVDTMPLIISQVKGLEVIKATLKNKGKADVAAVLEIKNKTDKPVIAVSVEIGDPEEAGGITVNGYKEGDEPPSVVIEPRGSITVRLSLNNAKPGDPIRVSAVVFADGSEDGEKIALETVHTQKAHIKANKSEGGTSPQ
jgi:hypothetical protein